MRHSSIVIGHANTSINGFSKTPMTHDQWQLTNTHNQPSLSHVPPR